MKKLLLLLTISSSIAVHNIQAAASNVTEIKTVQEYEDNITKGTTPIVIDFFAEWCGPCKRMAPLFGKMAEEFKDQVRFFKINTGNGALSSIIDQYNIRSIPTFIFKKGGSSSRRIGSMSETELRNLINQLIAS